MIALGPHADFIVTAYAVAMVVIAGLIAWVLFDHRAQRRFLTELEQRGVKRRARRAARK
jgi:heme exporter protein D